MTFGSASLTRRTVMSLMAGTAAAMALTGKAAAQSETIDVFSHSVHQNAATEGAGGDLLAKFKVDSGLGVNWTTLGDNAAIHERLLREVSLGQGTIDVGYILNVYATRNNLGLFTPLDEFMASDPIDDIAGIAPGLIAPMQLDGALYGIPIRHATNTILYNEAIFKERNEPLPTTFEELLAAARRLSFRRDDGVEVKGLAFSNSLSLNTNILRAYDADYMTLDGKITANSPAAVRAVEALAGLYADLALPRNIATLSSDEMNTLALQGRAAMMITNFGGLKRFNDPNQSQYPGSFKPLNMPMSESVKDKPYATTMQYWSLVIPANSTQKEAAWEFLKAFSSPSAHAAMAVNGNGSVRPATYALPEIQALLPYSADEAAQLATARLHLPAFEEVARAQDIFLEETNSAVLGLKTAQQAMDDAASRVDALI